jgi:hypothetical protein
MVVNYVSVGDEITVIVAHACATAFLVVTVDVLEQGMQTGRDEHPEMSTLAALGMKHEDAGSIRAKVRMSQCISAHRQHECDAQLHELFMPAAQRGLRDAQAIAL